jgi:ribosomal protein S18 acetylase RimI-like enzyme
MSNITISEYELSNGEYADKLTNFRIISLARRNKFYLDCIKSVIKPRGFVLFPKNYRILLARKKNGKILGFLIYTCNCFRGPEFYSFSIDYWLVDKKFQGQGVGKMLWNELEKVSKDYQILNMNVMFKADDEKLVAIYTKLGFSYIPKYRDIEQIKLSENGHTIWWRIVHKSVRVGGFFNESDANVVVLVE